MISLRIHAAILCFVSGLAGIYPCAPFPLVAASTLQNHNSRGPILVVGATGSTGLRAIQGLLDVGYKPRQLRLLTRNAKSPKCKSLKKAGYGIVEADLEDLEALRKNTVTRGCVGCYIHSTSSDTAELDKGELTRAENLASIILEENNKVRCVVYNSAAAQDNHGVGRITQKHDVEQVFERAVNKVKSTATNKKGAKRSLSYTSLRANIFMEELWKHYTRPQILKGVYPLPVPSSRKIYLVSVRDCGRLAGTILLASGDDHESRVRKINVAGDYLSARDIANTYAKAQQSPCFHHNPRLMTFKAWWYFPELYEQIRFLQTFTETTDIDELHKEFPGTLTSFAAFLEETKWSDPERTFEDLANVANLH